VALMAGIKTSTGIFNSDLCLSCLNPKSVSWAFKSFFLLLISSSGCRSVLQELKNFIGISKNKTTYKLIQELKACITKINNKTNLEIEFKTIKTSRKITHVKFIFCRTDLHPLDEINNKKNDLKAQLTDLGFKQERHKSLLLSSCISIFLKPTPMYW
jgi:plasmid replication initiation protein